MNDYLKIGRMTTCWGWILIFVGLLAAGCNSTKQSEARALPSPSATDRSTITNPIQEPYTIGDLVSVKFFGAEGMIPSHQERIKSDGTITLPLIGTVKAEVKTPGELLKEIHDYYVPRFYQRLVVTLDGGQNGYYVEGQVRSPGRQVCLGTTTMMTAMQSAGGFTDLAAQSRIELIRGSGEKIEVNFLKPSALGLQVFPGDRIIVPKRGSWDMYPQIR